MNQSNIEILPNRRQIDNKFPVLGFTVKTGGLPFYEVIVATDKDLFAPENAARRNAGNFFSSRQTGNRLQRADAGDTVYILPAAVLNGFAGQTPKPASCFYTLIAYADEQGGGARLSQTPEELVRSAPSVEFAPTFTGQTLSKVLGLDCNSLRRVESVSPGETEFSGFSPHAYYGGLSAGESEEGEAEDGYSINNLLGISAGLTDYGEEETHPEDGYELNQEETARGQSAPFQYSPEPDRSYGLGGEKEDYEDDYEDGFEGELGLVPQVFSRMQESVFPAGASEPDELYDEDSEIYGEGESYADWGEHYAAPESAFSAGDGGYHFAGAAAGAGVGSNGFGYRLNQAETSGYLSVPEDDFEDDYGESYGSEEDYSRAADTGEDGTSIAAERRIKARKKIVETIAKFESGSGSGRYKAINADQEFAAWKWHPAFGKYHIGLSYGIVQFTQDGGSLGKLLKMMRERDQTNFDKIFGGATLAAELIKTTTASGPFSKDVKGGRSVRVQPVGGADIWLSPWKERFEAAGDLSAFQAAQNELANDEYLEPILTFCQWLGLDTDRAVAMVYDRAVQMGVGGAKVFVIGAAGPVKTEALRNQALAALGKKDLKDFQSGFGGLTADGKWGPMTHAAMVSALRALGTKSPIPVPTREQMLDSLVRAAVGKDWEHRVRNLRGSNVFDDTNFLF